MYSLALEENKVTFDILSGGIGACNRDRRSGKLGYRCEIAAGGAYQTFRSRFAFSSNNTWVMRELDGCLSNKVFGGRSGEIGITSTSNP